MKLTAENLKKLFSGPYWRQKIAEACVDRFLENPPCGEIQGWLHPLEQKFLGHLASRVPKNGVIVEIGSYYGRSTCCLAYGIARGGNQATLWCVDTWTSTAIPDECRNPGDPDDIYDDFLKNTRSFGEMVRPKRGLSHEVARDWSLPIDLLFIDADHRYEGCSRDIASWSPWVKKGGLVLFHDSGEEGVRRAVLESDLWRNRRGVERVSSILLVRKG